MTSYVMMPYDLYGGHRIAAAPDPLPNFTWVVTDSLIIMDVERIVEKFTAGNICINWVETTSWEYLNNIFTLKI